MGNQIRNRRRRREPGGRPETPPGAAVGAGFRSGASATWCCVYCAGKISSRCRGSWGSRRRGPRSGVTGFLAAGQASLKSRAPDARDEDNRRLQAKIGELLMETELLDAKVDQLEAGGPLARRRSRR